MSADAKCNCGEPPYSGHFLWCEALRGRPEFRPREVTPETLTDEMVRALAEVADVRVATDCAALLSGRGGKAKLGLIRERVASAYSRYFRSDGVGPYVNSATVTDEQIRSCGLPQTYITKALAGDIEHRRICAVAWNDAINAAARSEK